MIFRAIFWIGLVAILMPHEPDLGFGRPAGLDTAVPTEVAAWTKQKIGPELQDPEALCRYNAHACATTATMLDDFKSMTVHGLAQVKADIAQNRRQRSSD